MPATAKQLAALKKGRAALKRKRALKNANSSTKSKANKNPKSKARKVTTKRPSAKTAPKRKVKRSTASAKRQTTARRKNPIQNFLFVAKSPTATKYWYTGEGFDSVKSRAKPVGRQAAVNASKKYAGRVRGYNFYWTGNDVKKPSGGRAKNPVPPSSKARVNRAAKLYEDFTGHDCDTIESVDYSFPKEAAKIGKVDGILYTTVRDGKTEKYIHKFKNSSRPTLAASYDGDKIALVGGNYKFKDSGINDI